MFDPSFLELMTQTVTRKAFLKRTQYGLPTYSTVATTYQARVVAMPSLVPDPMGINQVGTHTMWLATTQQWDPEDSCSFGGSTFRILEVANYPDQDGPHHVRLRTKGA